MAWWWNWGATPIASLCDESNISHPQIRNSPISHPVSDHCISSPYDSTGSHRRFADLPALHHFVKVSPNEDREMSYWITLPWIFLPNPKHSVSLPSSSYHLSPDILVCTALHRQTFRLVCQKGKLLNLELQLRWQRYTTDITCNFVLLEMDFQGTVALFYNSNENDHEKWWSCVTEHLKDKLAYLNPNRWASIYHTVPHLSQANSVCLSLSLKLPCQSSYQVLCSTIFFTRTKLFCYLS